MTAVYLDASAIVKLVVAEDESSALAAHLVGHRRQVTSSLSRVEVVRAVLRGGAARVSQAQAVLATISQIRIDDRLLDAAATLDPGGLRSVDAIHLASARALGHDLDHLVAYDRRLLAAATAAGLEVAAPGLS